MNRRIIASFAGVVLAIVCLSACTLQPKSTNPSDYPSLKGITPAPLVTSEPMEAPPVIDNAIIFVTDPVDTTDFQNPPGYNWTVWPQSESGNVTITLFEEDWIAFAKQLQIDPEVDPERVQLGFETMSSLVDYEAVVQDVHQYFLRYDYDIDLTTLDVSYTVRVFGR